MKFHISDVISITTGVFVSKNGMKGIHNILGFMTNDKVFTHQVPIVGKECIPYLVKQFPQLSEDNTKDDMEKLRHMLSNNKNKDEMHSMWLLEMEKKYGEYFDVEPIPELAHKK